MRYRQHRGGLGASLKTQIDIPRTIEAIASEASLALGRIVDKSEITVSAYVHDDRIMWDTHIVEVAGYGVLGFTDGPVCRITN